jgi:hypothetical protein
VGTVSSSSFPFPVVTFFPVRQAATVDNLLSAVLAHCDNNGNNCDASSSFSHGKIRSPNFS